MPLCTVHCAAFDNFTMNTSPWTQIYLFFLQILELPLENCKLGIIHSYDNFSFYTLIFRANPDSLQLGCPSFVKNKN